MLHFSVDSLYFGPHAVHNILGILNVFSIWKLVLIYRKLPKTAIESVDLITSI